MRHRDAVWYYTNDVMYIKEELLQLGDMLNPLSARFIDFD